MHIQLFNTDSEYTKSLGKAVRAAVENHIDGRPTEKTLHQIIVQSAGAYPVDVLATLNSLGISYQEDHWAYRANTLSKSESELAVPPSLFADPHPADYDWRFDSATVLNLTDRLMAEAKGGKIALFGTKTVFPPLIELGADVTLFNKSKAILDDLRSAGYTAGLVECDLALPLPAYSNSYSVVLADPPWYLDYYQAFLRRTAELLRVGGIMYLSVLPELTRPGAKAERMVLLEEAAAVGMVLVNQVAGSVSYETPGFEQQSLNAYGLYCQNWRRGDLWVFEKQQESNEGLVEPVTIDEPIWVEYRVGRKRIKVKPGNPVDMTPFSYRAADPSGTILTQVSRRSPFRKDIDVWSSDNYAYTVTGICVLHECFRQLEANHSIPQIVSTLVSQGLIHHKEQADLIALLDELTQ
ncbi:hypothetical protein GCM10023172_35990 [Hymenobacter ginsengisoli]|uniref:Methyltransferase n=1 Tax=Hymenobacter ginsengisoli TaxID=1051626 RepID=A0ABP8QQQ6_9BACT|nr:MULTISPECIES: class I SAM-dependent methyltransferase [unclassified Hymenobacter]MBO2033827.1 class I SAM-dependent methyltransferase [Hymenobacter sp. BT559]